MNEHLTTDVIIDYIHGALAPGDDALAFAHLQSCETCRADYDAEATLTETLRAAAAAEEREMPSLVKAAVWQRIREAEPSPLARVVAWLRPTIAVPAMAALIVGGWFASPYLLGRQPTIDATYYFEAHAAQSSEMPLGERSAGQMLEISMNASSEPTSPLEQAYLGYAAPDALDAVR